MHHPIRHWFEQYDGHDGDFSIAPRGCPFDVIPLTEATDTIVYCTPVRPHRRNNEFASADRRSEVLKSRGTDF